MEEKYRELAERNGWSYSLSGGRPYFMKNGNYAIPDENTSEEDKQLLAYIISEGSNEMAQLIQICWDNGIIISGPCSGIREFHNEPPVYLHFSFKAQKELIDSLYNNLKTKFPEFDHNTDEYYKRINGDYNGLVRYDISYNLRGKELTTVKSDEIFSIIKNQLQMELDNSKSKKR